MTNILPDTLVSIRGLQVNIMSAKGAVHAVRGADMDIFQGEICGLVGESGCGKTITAKSVMRLNPEDRLVYRGGIEYEGRDLLTLTEREMCEVRGKHISMIFQDPTLALDPLQPVGKQIEEVYRIGGLSRGEAEEKTLAMLSDVGIHPPEERRRAYPFEMSGGQLQRVMIAIALAAGPKLLIADEPTTALDVTVQDQILELLKDIRDKRGTSVFIITHDFGVIAEIADRVAVMYAGRIVETGEVTEIFDDARHPYTRDLIASIPRAGNDHPVSIPGAPPDLREVIVGCPYAPRCGYAEAKCEESFPEARVLTGTHRFHCVLDIPEARI
ncbi:MAG: ABC transporter ATP-binding protein [Clostridiales Family XIII bacterium]|jgi:oligopeptide/dipeptide ABC transporter ATP-binding protein|nr:ABC transporter ATP-binding protein [Clostridiales Family XIII bacterium]